MWSAVYKDLAKWLIGFVPVATLLGMGVAIAPDAPQIAAHGPGGLTLLAGLAVLTAMVAMLGTCAYVLAAGPSTWAQLTAEQGWMSAAFSTYSVGRPYFLDSTKFDDADLACRTDPTDSRLKVVADVSSKIVALSADLNARARFKTFLWVFVIGSLVVVAGVLTVLISSTGVQRFYAKPTSVTLHVPSSATGSFGSATGCTSPATTQAVAIGGTLDAPELRLFGPGCQGTSWSPPNSLGILVTTG
jgi:hypothetical protein